MVGYIYLTFLLSGLFISAGHFYIDSAGQAIMAVALALFVRECEFKSYPRTHFENLMKGGVAEQLLQIL